MNLEEAIKKISRYLQSKHPQALIVDVQNNTDLEYLETHFNVDGINFTPTSFFCKPDELPRIDSLLYNIAHNRDTMFLTELGSFLKLYGEQRLVDTLKNILCMSIDHHLVVLTYNCKKYLLSLAELDPRIRERICIIDSEEQSNPPHVIFTRIKYHAPNAIQVEGINQLGYGIEKYSEHEIYIETNKNTDSYPLSLYKLIDMNNTYTVLTQMDNIFCRMEEGWGTEDKWASLLSMMNTGKSFVQVVDEIFSNHKNLELMIPHYKVFNEEQKWLYFLALKIYGSKNTCLNEASKKTLSYSTLVSEIYCSLLAYEYTDKHFGTFYNERRNILSNLEYDSGTVSSFCSLVKQKGFHALYYLTDNSDQEKELIFELIHKHEHIMDFQTLSNILEPVYPSLWLYLKDYNFQNDLFDTYFQLYKYSKLTNKIHPELYTLVSKQASSREFNFLLEPRCTILEKIDKTDSQLYFFDALGVEFLSFILQKCNEYKLHVKASICRANLPTITSKNKEFVEDFQKNSLPIKTIKDLDKIKHDGVHGWDYLQTKLPIHLSEELKVIDKILVEIKSELTRKKCKKVIIVSDHGASRLAVINEHENLWKMNSKGEYSGRCCPVSEMDIQSEYVTEADGFWVLANYDRFKGSRKASVEVHGGASLEEVVVPIIEITSYPEKIEVFILEKEIFVSYKKKALINVFSTAPLTNVSIMVDEHKYEPCTIDESTYSFELLHIKRAGNYSVDVYSEGNIIIKNLLLLVKSESVQEKDLL